MTDRLHGFYYTPLFCEENIWHLANSLIQQEATPEQLSIVFISNPDQHVAIFNQKTEKTNQPVMWDYHVVLIRHNQNQALVYDFDSLCPFPVTLEQYLEASFPSTVNVRTEYQAQFRLVSASDFLAKFYSDRSHMLGIVDKKNFPEYPIIKPDTGNDLVKLHEYINFNQLLFDHEKMLKSDQLLHEFNK